ncbi:hypothetical protein BCON_0424g00020 [Botryotinia convoluta]|uniref:Heterokaryon incompatibility domain-containing protein n=1 Tax=Botryotinia convoluta TaxID=54673 RepID=A0A4Z1H8B6_9HELO|nr:hypothetical protein BCON_0424g00020 [Botryotinia convoluta]
MANNRYQYKTLTEHDSIRLLVLPPSVDTTADIHCDLLTTTLIEWQNDMFNSYTALSYVWGDTKNKKMIYINNEVFEVTTNLDSALRDIRDPLRERYLWIDAICINQADKTERSKQVSQMAKIYQVARHTIIYLGESTESSTELLGAISRGYNRIPNPLETAATDMLALFFNDITFYTTEKYHRAQNMFWEILERPWFTRIWVLQELLFSVEPWVQCGRIRVRWEQLFQVIETISISSFASSRPPESYNRFVAMDRRRDLFNPRRKPSKVSAEDLLDLLTDRRGLGVSDSRDMLFAHKGILQGSPDINSFGNMELTVDYFKRKEDVFIDLVRYCVDTSPYGRTLEVLSYVEGGNVCCREGETLNLPSWTPDWTLKGCSRPHRRLREMTQGRRDDELLKRFKETPWLYKTSYLWRNASLISTGWWVGSIKKVSNVITPAQAGWSLRKEDIILSLQPSTMHNVLWTQALTKLYNHWCGLLKPLWCDTNLTEPPPEIFSRSPRLTDLFIKPDLNVQMLDKIAKKLLWYTLYSPTTEIAFQKITECAKALRSTLSVILLAHAVIDQGEKAERICSEVLYNRKFATLDNGTLVLVPATAMEGDIVCLLAPDSTTHFVLRPKCERSAALERENRPLFDAVLGTSKHTYSEYKFVGECHIDTPCEDVKERAIHPAIAEAHMHLVECHHDQKDGYGSRFEIFPMS